MVWNICRFRISTKGLQSCYLWHSFFNLFFIKKKVIKFFYYLIKLKAWLAVIVVLPWFIFILNEIGLVIKLFIF